MIHRFEIIGRLPGLNQMIASQGRPWWVGRGVKEKAMKDVMFQLRVDKMPIFTKPIILRIRWIEPNARRDRDNVTGGGSKIILDAMKQMGAITDDSRRWVRDIQHDTSQIDKAKPRIELEIEEVI